MSHQQSEPAADKLPPTIALLPWGNVIEDFLDTIGISLASFCSEFSGSWIFGYVGALRAAGVRTVVICISADVAAPQRHTHGPSGATIWVLPAPWVYRALRRRTLNPYGRSVRQVFGQLRGAWHPLWPALVALRQLILYLSTPLGRIGRVIRHERCGAILCQEYEYPRFDMCVLLGKLLHVPVFATFQGGNYQRSQLERVLRPLAMRLADGLIIAAQAEIQRVQARYRIPASRLARIFNPIDLGTWYAIGRAQARAALQIPADACVVAWHGRVSVQKKGLDVLIAAWELLCQSRPQQQLELLLVGGGHDAAELRRQIASRGLRGVRWCDEFSHDRALLRNYLSAADVYVFPSRQEGFAVAPIEAMACGLPVVAADANGVRDILESEAGNAGVIVPCGDAQALAQALDQLLSDDLAKQTYGVRARDRVASSFSLEVVGRQLRGFLFPSCAADSPWRTEAEREHSAEMRG
jgi:starch synthase